MLLNKTALAREALVAGPNGGLSLRERRILIVTDGRRTLNEVMGLLGPGILPEIDRLIREGYIDDGRAPAHATSPAVVSSQGLGSALGGLIRAATESVHARTEMIRAGATRQVPSPVEPSPASAPASRAISPAPATNVEPPAPRGSARRSLVAAKMYVVDMLQLQRHPDAVELKARIQCTSGQGELLEAILAGMDVLVQLTNASYGQRIMSRLGEVLPEDALPALMAAIAAQRVPEHATPPQLKVVGG